MSQSILDIMIIFEDELKSLGANIGRPELIVGGMPFHVAHGGTNIQLSIDAFQNKDFEENLIRDLAKKLISRFKSSNIGKAQTFSFKELLLPSNTVLIACKCQRGNIIFRYMEVFRTGTDDIIKRIDICI